MAKSKAKPKPQPKPTLQRARKIVDELGISLVYPIDNRAAPPSLWSELHPNIKNGLELGFGRR